MSTVVEGIEMSFVPAPLHHVHVQSKIVTGFFPVAVSTAFPIDGVYFIMGNDIAGGKVYPVSEVVNVSIATYEPDELAQELPVVFSVNALTRAQSRQQTPETDLSDSLFASVLSKDKLPSSSNPLQTYNHILKHFFWS